MARAQQHRMSILPGGERTSVMTMDVTKSMEKDERHLDIPTHRNQRGWLYEMIGINGSKPIYGPHARAWLKQKYAIADLSSRPLHEETKWWETTVNQETAEFLQEHAEDEGGQDVGEEEGKAQLPEGAMAVPLEELLKNHRYRTEFYDFLEENYQQQCLDFLEQVDLWRSKSFGPAAESKKKEGFDLKSFLANNIYEQFIGEDSENPIALDQTAREALLKAIETPSELVLTTFDAAVASVKKFLREEMLPAFSETDEFRDLVHDSQPEPVTRTASATTVDISDQPSAGELGFADTSGLEVVAEEGEGKEFPLGQGLLPKAKPWFNAQSYRSIQVQIIDSREPQPKKKYNAYVSVDSKTISTPEIRMSMPGADWNLTMHLPLLNTTQWLTIQLFSEKVLLGTQNFQIADIYDSMEDQSDEGKKYRIEGKWFPLDYKPKGSKAELQLKLSLSTVPLSDGQMEELEKNQVMPEDYVKNNKMADKIRGKVSKKKLRFKDDGYDLDLTYITPRLLAMGYPSEGVEGTYRNSMKDVQSFFTRRHPQAYRLYNLCSERKYDKAKFQNSVVRFPFDDHNPPPFEMIPMYCENLREWLTEHPQHVAAIHCKAGKGRTGTMIAAYLLYVGHSTTAKASLDFFAERRTKNNKGVTIPSQKRFVKYFAKYCALKRINKPCPGRTTLFLSKIVMLGIPKGMGRDFFFLIKQNGGGFQRAKYDSNKLVPCYVDNSKKQVTWDLSKLIIPLEENVLFVFKAKKPITGQQEKFAQCWINTRWEDLDKEEDDQDPYLELPKTQLDKACKDVKKHKIFDENFAIRIHFSETPMSSRVKELELAGQVVVPYKNSGTMSVIAE
jgi:phosphatidylinositol-3,4,5-trisphosphate 3-phosphatase/dual-specificity protein phosphatase PTEN